MNRTDRHLEMLASRARQASMPDETHAPIGFAIGVLKVCRPLTCDLTSTSRSESKAWNGWFFDRPLTRSHPEPDGTLLLMKFSLASLPVGAVVMITCLLWFGTDVSHDIDDLATSFLQSPWVP